jgi:hypothetical protein
MKERKKMGKQFEGVDYQHERDSERLTSQIKKIKDTMQDGQWRTLKEIASSTGAPEASVSAQLRNLRKEKHGGHKVNRKHISNGLYLYQLILRRPIEQLRLRI